MAACWEIAAHSAYDMFYTYKYLIVNLFFPPRFLSENFILIAPFPDHCLLVPFHFSLYGPELLVCCLAHRGSTGVSLLLQIFSKLLGAQGSPSSGSLLNL